MRKYIAAPQGGHFQWSNEVSSTADVVIHDEGSRSLQPTGLYDHRGNRLYRLPEPLGFSTTPKGRKA